MCDETKMGTYSDFLNLLDTTELGVVSPSTLMAYASLLENCPYINGSPQNTFVPALVEFAKSQKLFLAGDDLKTG